MPGQQEPDTPFRRKCRITWAALIKAVYEVDPLKCPKCGGTMKIVSFVEEAKIIEKILRHCELWKEPAPHPPPGKILGPPKVECGPELDYQLLSLRFLSVKYPAQSRRFIVPLSTRTAFEKSISFFKLEPEATMFVFSFLTFERENAYISPVSRLAFIRRVQAKRRKDARL